MITIDELKTQLGEYETAVKDLGEALAITASEKRVAELEHKMSQPGFYDDAEASQKVFAEVSDLKGKLERYGPPVRRCRHHAAAVRGRERPRDDPRGRGERAQGGRGH